MAQHEQMCFKALLRIYPAHQAPPIQNLVSELQSDGLSITQATAVIAELVTQGLLEIVEVGMELSGGPLKLVYVTVAGEKRYDEIFAE